MKWGVPVLVLTVFAVGGAFGFLVGHGTGGSAGQLGATRGDAAPRAPAAPSPVRRSPDESGSSSSAALGARVGQVDAPSVPTGDGQITGHVRDASGHPLAGVLVRANYRNRKREQSSWVRGDGPPKDRDLDTVLRKAAENYRYSREARREGTTDTTGAFTITGMADGDWYVNAWLKGYEIRRSGGGYVHPGDKVDFTAHRLFTLPITVLMPDGTKPDKATIRVSRNRGTRSSTWRADQAFVRLDAGVFKVQAIGGEDDVLQSKSEEVTAEGSGPLPPLTLKLVDSPGIRGMILMSSPEQNLYGNVYAVPAKSGSQPSVQEVMRSRRRSSFYSSSRKFMFRDLKPGKWFVAAVLNNQTMLASATVDVGDHMVVKDLRVADATPDQYVVVAVEAPDGTPVTDAQIQAICTIPDRGNGYGNRVQKMPDGTYRVFHPHLWNQQGKDLPEGKYTVVVTSKKYGQKRADYVPGQSGRVTVRFEDPAFVEITVSGLSGSDLEGDLNLQLRPKSNRRQGMPWFPGGSNQGQLEDGKATFGPLSPGSYEAVLYLRNNQYGSRPIGSFPMDLGPGKQEQTVPLPPLYSLTITVPAGDEKGSVYLGPRNRSSNPFGFSSSQRVEGGKVVFDNIPAGDYTVYVSGSQSGRMFVTVPGQSVIDFVPVVLNAMLVHVTDPSGTMAKAGLADGDLIVGVDGKQFDNAQQMSALLMLARTKKSTRLSVMRGNRVREIVVNDLKSLYGRGAGGRWEQTSR